jgi:hypothetical protein
VLEKAGQSRDFDIREEILVNPEQGWSADKERKKETMKMVVFWIAILGFCFGLAGVVKYFTPDDTRPPKSVLQVAPRITVSDDEGLLFHGYSCSGNCSVHLKGYCWARKKHVQDEYSCRSNSKSFMQGCLAYYKKGAFDRDFDESYQQDKSIAELCGEL